MPTIGDYLRGRSATRDAAGGVAFSDVEVSLALELTRRGLSFCQQVRVGGYVLDFLVDGRLCVEVDGRHHEQQVVADYDRDRALRDEGIWTLRIPARVVIRNAEEAGAIVATRLYEQRYFDRGPR